MSEENKVTITIHEVDGQAKVTCQFPDDFTEEKENKTLVETLGVLTVHYLYSLANKVEEIEDVASKEETGTTKEESP